MKNFKKPLLTNKGEKATKFLLFISCAIIVIMGTLGTVDLVVKGMAADELRERHMGVLKDVVQDICWNIADHVNENKTSKEDEDALEKDALGALESSLFSHGLIPKDDISSAHAADDDHSVETAESRKSRILSGGNVEDLNRQIEKLMSGKDLIDWEKIEEQQRLDQLRERHMGILKDVGQDICSNYFDWDDANETVSEKEEPLEKEALEELEWSLFTHGLIPEDDISSF